MFFKIKSRNEKCNDAFWIYIQNYLLESAIEKEVKIYYLKKEILFLLGKNETKKESEDVIVVIAEIALKLKKIKHFQGEMFYKNEKERYFKNATKRFCQQQSINEFFYILINMHAINQIGVKKRIEKVFQKFYPHL